jgi:hypothetical protein
VRAHGDANDLEPAPGYVFLPFRALLNLFWGNLPRPAGDFPLESCAICSDVFLEVF